MKKLFNKIFRLEKIDGDSLCPPYLYRWTLFTIGESFKIYLHQFVGEDWAKDPHDHPKRFISIGLKGWYWEYVYDKNGVFDVRKHKAPWVRTFSAHHLHRIDARECGNCWTLVITLKSSRQWGFVQDGKWHHWKKYVWGGIARKSC